MNNPINYQVEVLAEGEWVGNQIILGSLEEAENYADNIQSRWMKVRAYRIMKTEKPINYYFVDGKLIPYKLQEAENGK